MTKQITICAVLCMLFVGAMPGEAHAYLDPGTGSIILQALAAALLAVVGAWYALKTKIKNLFTKKSKGNETQNEGEK